MLVPDLSRLGGGKSKAVIVELMSCSLAQLIRCDSLPVGERWGFNCQWLCRCWVAGVAVITTVVPLRGMRAKVGCKPLP